jgi:hypothetical protein
MTEPSQPSPRPKDDTESRTVLMLRSLDGGASAREIASLKELLARDAASRQLFVDICQIHGGLLETYAPNRAALHEKVTREIGPLLASAATPPIQGGPSSKSVSPQTRELAESAIDMHVEPLLAPDAPAADPGAETIIRTPAAEDTIYPVLNDPPK